MQNGKLTLSCAVLILSTLSIFAESPQNVAKKPNWSMGDKWEIEVSTYTRPPAADLSEKASSEEEEESVEDKYNLTVTITDKVKHDGSDCWQLEFVPGAEAPPEIRKMKYRLLVSQDSGVLKEMKAIRRDKGKKSAKKLRLKRIQGLNLRMEEEKGFPLTVIPWGQKPRKLTAEEKSKNRYWTVSVEKEIWKHKKEKKVNQNVILFQLKTRVKPESRGGWSAEFTVRQKWSNKYSWWTEFIRFDSKGRKLLRAKLEKELE